jgi:protoporphyrin/coproporphyrin ferrochelatase
MSPTNDSQRQCAILLLAHGTPNTLGEMAEYLSKVTGGRALPDAVVKELQHRYAEIGLAETPGPKPPHLTRWTLRQRDLLEQELHTPVFVGMRNWHPFIPDVIAEMRAEGFRKFRAICLAPQNSRTSVGLYRRAVLAASEGLEVDFIAGWAEHPLLIQAFAEKLWPVWAEACAVASSTATDDQSRRVPILFTAHSVPCRTIMTGEAASGRPGLSFADSGARPTAIPTTPDTYPVEAKRTAQLVASRLAPLGLRDSDWYFAFQSQGVSGGPWIGPTVEETLKAIRDEGHTAVVIQPIGFLCDHVEILYDIDIAFTESARELGLRLWRAESLNDSPTLIKALAQIAKTPATTGNTAEAQLDPTPAAIAAT